MLTDREKKEMAVRLDQVKASIRNAAVDCGRSPEEITLIGVSKFFPADHARAAFELGLKDLGENRVQEMVDKIDLLHAGGIEPNWHLIGTLQKNKVKYIIGKTHLIHSVDSIELLQEISKRSSAQGIMTDVLLQVNVSGEQSKHGFEPLALLKDIKSMSSLPGVRMRGLMTMAPISADPDDTLPVFSDTAKMAKELRAVLRDESFDILSMGMSQDYRQAIACGATHIRIGTAIFGARV